MAKNAFVFFLYNILLPLVREGPDVFYGGRIGAKLVEDVQAAGGILTLQDLRDYR